MIDAEMADIAEQHEIVPPIAPVSSQARRLCQNVHAAQKLWQDWKRWDDRMVLEWARGQRWAFWERQYVEGRIDVDEFERFLGPLP